jgi:NAD(P)-dependent dehydrogenase (short-subunit alcohol dehydrogenase family)
MASNAGLAAVRNIGVYTAAKHGVVGLTRSGGTEYADDGIRVNAVAPAAIRTRLMTGITPEQAELIAFPQAMRSRVGEPEEVAAAVVWLCSEDASFVTGVTLPVDAGSLAWLSIPKD